jgi:peroxiredoxin (alkyl hydroperoxide reductase subunit C)
MMTHVPAAGEAAPDFTLDTTAGTPVTLSSFKGKKNVLVAFFPLAFTSTCTTELCAFTEDYESFTSKDVEVIPVSVDAVPSLKVFKAQQNLAVELASDFKRTASRDYGVLMDATFFSNRAYFLIDKAGIVRWAHVEANPGLRRENSEILAQIAALPA